MLLVHGTLSLGGSTVCSYMRQISECVWSWACSDRVASLVVLALHLEACWPCLFWPGEGSWKRCVDLVSFDQGREAGRGELTVSLLITGGRLEEVCWPGVFWSGEGSQTTPPGAFPGTDFKLPTVTTEIIRIASERHQKGLMHPMIYQLLTQVGWTLRR